MEYQDGLLKIAVLAACLTGFTARHGLAQDKIAAPPVKEVTREVLLDRIYGGWAGMLIGGIEGLAHEFKYKEQPRATLPDFTFLKNGARTDDDNDFEWTHLWFMDREQVTKLPYPRIVEIWQANMNKGIWVANLNARRLMDKGVVPPETGSVARNPAAWYNLSGQFCVESYGLIAPGMPQAAAEIGLHYAHIAVSEEPLQAAQYWTSLISLRAFHEGALEDAKALTEAGVFAIVLELVTPPVAKEVSEAISVPTIGIGSGPDCDGQILVTPDLTGSFPWFTPRFVKPKANCATEIKAAVADWKREMGA